MPIWIVLTLLGLAGATAAGEGAAVRGLPLEVAVRPGERAADLARRLEAAGVLPRSVLIRIAATEEWDEFPFVPPPTRDSPLRRFEGLFVPGVYDVPPGGDAYERGLALVGDLLARSGARLARAGAAGPLGARQSIILASIVEKEAAGGSGYGRVASVFLNRLRHGMPLASCPATEYGLGYHRPYLLRSDLEVDTLYNTYRHRGLPPTPICFFSDEALQAVLQPPDTGLYFFCLDWTTLELRFAADFAGHQANVDASRRNFIERFGADRLFRRYPDKFYEP